MNYNPNKTENYQSRIADTIRTVRTERGWSQKDLADRLGVTVQAVSKWETGSGIPDVLMLPEIVRAFGITMDEMFFDKDAAEPQREREVPRDVPQVSDGVRYFPDDGVIRVAQFRGNTLLQADDVDAGEISLVIPEDLLKGKRTLQFEFFSDVSCGDIFGAVTANGAVNCSNVYGSVNSGAEISCGDVYGSVTTDGGSVECGAVVGDVTTDSGCVECGDVGGNVTTDSGCVECGDVGGNVTTDSGCVECGDVGGNVTTDGGDVNCGDVGDSVTTEGGDVSCGVIGGNVSVEGGDVECAGAATKVTRQKVEDARQRIQQAIEQINHHPESVTCKGKPLSADITDSVKQILEATVKRLEKYEKKQGDKTDEKKTDN